MQLADMSCSNQDFLVVRIHSRALEKEGIVKIQSLSINVPGGCFNKCKFCVARLHPSNVPNLIEGEPEFQDLHTRDYVDAMQFARDNGCNTMIYTGDGEPLMNQKFLDFVSMLNNSLEQPFRWIELQTAGYKLQQVNDKRNIYARWLRNTVRVKLISLSLSDIFSSDNNALYNVTPERLKVNIEKTCSEIKRYGFTLRLSLNMTDFYNDKRPEQVFERALELGANQLTFRKLYKSDSNVEINNFIENHSAKEEIFNKIIEYVSKNGHALEVLPFGATKYSVHGISVVIDNDCMSTDVKEELKYLILQPNCKLYSKWNDLGSILF